MPKIVDHEQRRDEIALVACRVVAQYGFEQATVARIAREAGYTTGMVAHYFDTKQDIIIAALRLILRRIEERLTPNAEQADLLTLLGEALPVDDTRFTECAFWIAFWGQMPSRQAAQAHQWLAASRVSAPLRALSGARLERMARLAAVGARSGAALGHDLHQRHYRQHRSQPQRLAGHPANRAAAFAARTAARLGGGRAPPRPASCVGCAARPPEETSMDFALSEEQQLIIATTREFVRQELVPHEREVEESGVLREELREQLKAKAIAAGLYAANMPTEVGGGGLDTRQLGAVREGAGLHRLRPALRLCRAAVQHPAGVPGRAARALPAAGRARRACRVPGHDRAAGRLRSARHEGERGAAGRRLHHQRHQALHQPRRPCRLRHPVRGYGRGALAARQAQAHHGLPRRHGHAGLRGASRLPQRLASRLYQQHPAVQRLPRAGGGGARRGAPRLRGRQYLAGRDAPAGRGHLPGARRTRARAAPSSGRSSGCSSGSRSASSRASRSSSPTWHWSCGPPSC